jgi:hypothetical protein
MVTGRGGRLVTSSAGGFETFSSLSKRSLENKNKENSSAFISKGYQPSPLIRFLEHLKLCSVCVTLQKYFSHPSLVIYFFFNLTHKTETGTADR